MTAGGVKKTVRKKAWHYYTSVYTYISIFCVNFINGLCMWSIHFWQTNFTMIFINIGIY